MYGVHICLSKWTERERGKDKYVVCSRTEQRDGEEKMVIGKEKEKQKRKENKNKEKQCFLSLFLINVTFYSYTRYAWFISPLCMFMCKYDYWYWFIFHSGWRIAVAANQQVSIRSKRGDGRSRHTNQKATCLLVSESEISITEPIRSSETPLWRQKLSKTIWHPHPYMPVFPLFCSLFLL